MEALIRGLRSRPFNELTVSGIAADANVGRTTFYEHFSDKDELLDAVVDELLATFTRGGEFRIGRLIDHVVHQPELCRAMFAVDGFRQRCVEALARRLGNQDEPTNRFAAHGLLGALEDWTQSAGGDEADLKIQLTRNVESILAAPSLFC